MALSTNSIMHYTKNFKNLCGILESGFSVKYCKEEFLFGEETHLRFAYPMVCFCDIPLSNVKNHLKSYGHYGIGLTKEWATQKKLNPVLYLENYSSLTTSILGQAQRIAKNKSDISSNQDVDIIDNVWLQDLLTLSSFMKNYEGNLIRNKVITNYRFYDEREWRYVPTSNELCDNLRAININDYIKYKNEYNQKVGQIKLNFDNTKDITYIIVRNEKDIHRFIKFITSKFKKKLTEFDIEILMTKILTTKQITNDL